MFPIFGFNSFYIERFSVVDRNMGRGDKRKCFSSTSAVPVIATGTTGQPDFSAIFKLPL